MKDALEAFCEANKISKIPFVLRFSNRWSGTEGVTVSPHAQISDAVDHCWWGWWRPEHDIDGRDLELLTNITEFPIWIGLWNRSASQAYMAKCEKIETRHGERFTSPEKAATPSYYRDSAWPAWLQLTNFFRVTGETVSRESEARDGTLEEVAALESLFRDFSTDRTDATIIWLDEIESPKNDTVLNRPDRNVVLHISDPHFGRFHAWSSDYAATTSDVTAFEAIEDSFEEQRVDPQSIAAIVLSGDLISGEREVSEQRKLFSQARAFLDRLFKFTNMDASGLVVVPGNHDVTRHVIDPTVDSAFDHSKTRESAEDLDRRKEGEIAYREFLASLRGDPAPVSTLRRFNIRYRYALNFIEMNSTLPRDQFTKEFGFIGEYPLQLLRSLRTAQRQQMAQGKTPVNFGVLHHHVVSTVDDECVPLPDPEEPTAHVDPVSMTLDASNLIDWAAQYQLRFLLHGHQHRARWRFIGNREGGEASYATEIVGAGSLGATWVPKNEGHSYNLYDFNEDQTITGRTVLLDGRLKGSKISHEVRVPASGHLGNGKL